MVEQRFDMIQKNLLQSIMSKELLHEEKYVNIIIYMNITCLDELK